jgi:rod shape-determining protein MreD
MIWLVMFFVSVVCGLLQALLPPSAVLGQAKLPLLLAVTVYYALNHNTATASVSALMCGTIHDLMSFIPLGQTAVVYLFAAILAGRFRRLVHGDEIHTTAMFGGLAAFICTLISYRLLARIDLVSISAGKLWYKAAGGLVLGAVSSPFVCLFLHKIDSMVGNIATTEVIEDVID